ncbi:magnesium citrate secondary transporter [Pontibacter silvestris]|uniref:Magnesium citrate secondary transporter n=1 Tax=Pontibacter silvestris TaxID=2305183 RepID=A0ABW4WVQ5_9BACT|nr:magnesium citrate secondary transporter [Pontibacter silvestris]MCC9138512.1 magnesium citrate secondary transporter [Pontibacter silvestris]
MFFLNQALELADVSVWPLHAYLDDLLCMPIVLTIALAAERVYFQNPQYVIPLHYIIGAVVAFGAFFELLLPFIYTKHIADIADVVAYAAGAAIFQLTINKPTH